MESRPLAPAKRAGQGAAGHDCPEPARSRSAATDLVLMTRQGVRVEGLDRETLIAVLRALA
jgi:hypothetical protein